MSDASARIAAERFGISPISSRAAVANRGRAPQQIFGEKLSQVNTSGHYTSQPLTPERVETLSREKMIAFYRDRFANAAETNGYAVDAGAPARQIAGDLRARRE